MTYASPYYDPVKAHEYYMEHRELKGRKKKTNTIDLNETGKTAAKVVKENLNKEKKEKAKRITEETSAKVKALRSLLSGLTKEQKEARRPAIEAAIAQLREQSSAAKEALGIEYENKYADEMGKIKEDSSMKREFKRGSTIGLNEEGKEAARQVKEKLTEERQQKIEEHRTNTQNKIDEIKNGTTQKREEMNNDISRAREDLAKRKEDRKASLDSYKSQTNGLIEAIRNRISGMTKAQRARNAGELYEAIEKLQTANKEKTATYKSEVDKDRADTNTVIKGLRDSYKTYSTDASNQIKQLRTDNSNMRKQLKTEYQEKYYDEIDKIRADEDMRDY